MRRRCVRVRVCFDVEWRHEGLPREQRRGLTRGLGPVRAPSVFAEGRMVPFWRPKRRRRHREEKTTHGEARIFQDVHILF